MSRKYHSISFIIWASTPSTYQVGSLCKRLKQVKEKEEDMSREGWGSLLFTSLPTLSSVLTSFTDFPSAVNIESKTFPAEWPGPSIRCLFSVCWLPHCAIAFYKEHVLLMASGSLSFCPNTNTTLQSWYIPSLQYSFSRWPLQEKVSKNIEENNYWKLVRS